MHYQVDKTYFIQSGRHFVYPLLLEVADKSLVCSHTLRVLPKKRLTSLGCWQEKPVVVKFFYDAFSGYRHAYREKKGITHLIKHTIPTPEIFYFGKLTKGVYVLVFKYIKESMSFKLLWEQSTSPQEKFCYLRKFLDLLAKLHRVGLYQTDLHLENFLYQPDSDTLYALDGAGIQASFKNKTLSLKVSMKNLALFLNQLSTLDEDIKNKAITYYLSLRGWENSSKLQRLITNYFHTLQQSRTKSFLKKTLRDSTPFKVINDWRQYAIWTRQRYSAELKELLNRPETLFLERRGVLLKDGKTCTIRKINIAGKDYVVKRYNIKNVLHRLRRSVSTSRAIHAWKNAHHLAWLGLPTAKPLALIEHKWGGLKANSYFVYEYIEGPCLNHYFFEAEKNQHPWIESALAVIDLFAKLYQAGIRHGDLKATNIIFSENQPFLIDLDSMRHFPKINHQFYNLWQQDMQRFMKNWHDLPQVATYFYKQLRQKGLLL